MKQFVQKTTHIEIQSKVKPKQLLYLNIKNDHWHEEQNDLLF